MSTATYEQTETWRTCRHASVVVDRTDSTPMEHAMAVKCSHPVAVHVNGDSVCRKSECRFVSGACLTLLDLA